MGSALSTRQQEDADDDKNAVSWGPVQIQYPEPVGIRQVDFLTTAETP